MLSSKLFLSFVSFLLIFLAISFVRETYRKHHLSQEIEKLKAETEKLEGRNHQLAKLMDYLKEESHLEKEARLRFNLKKPGEKVVILPDNLTPEEGKDVLESPSSKEEEETVNYWRWWEYFFVP